MDSSNVSRKITVNMYLTLDGYGEFPEYPGSNIVQDQPDDAWKAMWTSAYDKVDTIIYGRNSYLGHSQFHALSKRRPEDAEFLFDFSRFIESCEMIVLSHNLKDTEWGNTRIVQGDLSEIVNNLKNEPGKDIIVDAGPSLVNEFIRRDLADEYKMVIFPVILGRGHHYWSLMSEQRTLKLLSSKALEYGELYLHYERVKN